MPILPRHRQGKEAMKHYTNSEIEKVIDEYIHNKRDRAVTKSRLIDGMCYEPLAEKYDLSVRQVKNIIYRCEDVVFRHI